MVCRLKSITATPWLPHLIHLKLQDNLITHMGPLPNLPFLQTLDLSFNHITGFSVVQTLASFQHLRSLRVNDNPVQHEPRFYFSLQRLMPWTQHEFGHARHFPDDHQIRIIQQEAVLKSPRVFQAHMQGRWGICNSPTSGDPLNTVRFPGTGVLPCRDRAVANRDQHRARNAARDADQIPIDAGDARTVPGSGATAVKLSQHDLMMLEGAARRMHRSQVLTRLHSCKTCSPGGHRLALTLKPCSVLLHCAVL